MAEQIDNDNEITLDWIRNQSLQSLMGLKPEQLYQLQWQADRQLFRAELTKKWIDGAVQFKQLNPDQESGAS